ncbi:ATP-dependent DNA helicase RecG [Bacteroides luti]|uniref:ATP-dependent DNA helicase RecG n=1 Tax=Bacteroides luti TaxID=1297750 RepID=A0A1M5FWR9_9BACE|nr:RNA-binding domain-containing protein [Bacteroides luti]SHF95948.1 ATP-dependent DNA helicase RecG [Bacteroides luti]
MKETELQNYLKQQFPIENESCEWKEFSKLKHFIRGNEGEDIISYISAISNMNGGHLIIGVEDKSLKIKGIQDFASFTKENVIRTLLDSCTNLSSEGLFVDEYFTEDTNKYVWILHIPKHQKRLPVYAHKKAWQRIGDSLIEMRKERKETILAETTSIEDWSANIIEEATITDLDSDAIAKARNEYKKRNPKYAEEVDNWSNEIFLNKAKLTRNGKITNAALILLGKEESEHFLSPSVAKIRWNLKTLDNQDKDFEIFSIPLLLSVEEVFRKIRNLKYRYLRDSTLFPEELLRYEPFNIRELIQNCIAHQDYTKGARINVVEFEDDHLVFSNYGEFIPKSVETVVTEDSPEEYYRNPYLVEAMRNLNMIDTQGGGIRKIYNFQRARLFPMPDYDLSGGKVKATLTGRILNEEFAKILINTPTLSLQDIITLDKVQKKRPISEQEYRYINKLGFIEGRRPNIYLSYKVVKSTKNEKLKAQYIKNKSFDDNHFKRMIIEYIKKYGSASKAEISELLHDKLSDILNDQQKDRKVGNLLSALKKNGKIENSGYSKWKLI